MSLGVLGEFEGEVSNSPLHPPRRGWEQMHGMVSGLVSVNGCPRSSRGDDGAQGPRRQ
jgi:hypothetical protein